MAVFHHYLMAQATDPDQLLEKYPLRYLIHAITGEDRAVKFAHEHGVALEDRIVVVFNEAAKPDNIPDNRAFHVDYNTSAPSDIVKAILERVEELGWRPNDVGLDVTSFPTEYALLLLKGLKERLGAERNTVIYTEATAYGSNPFTHGLKEINVIPGYNGSPDVLKTDMLVIIVGFEGHRSSAVHTHMDPEALIVINGFPAMQPGWESRSFSANLELIVKTGCEVLKSPANNPFEMVNVLESLYDQYAGTHNLNIAPLGSTPQVIGAGLFALRRPDVRLIYHYPKNVVPKMTGQVGRTWIYVVTYADLAGET